MQGLTNDIDCACITPHMPPPKLSQDSQRLLGRHIVVCCQQAIQEVLDASVQLLIAMLLIGPLDVCMQPGRILVLVQMLCNQQPT